MKHQAEINTEVFVDILDSYTDGNGSIISFSDAMVKAASYTWFKSISETDDEMNCDFFCFEYARREFMATR
jgi:hypothetical protein